MCSSSFKSKWLINTNIGENLALYKSEKFVYVCDLSEIILLKKPGKQSATHSIGSMLLLFAWEIC